MKTEIVTIFIGLFITVAQTVELPPFIKVCRQSDPEISKCAVKSANEVLPIIVEGIRPLNIPNMKPLKLPFVQVETVDNFQLNFTDLEIHGLDKTHVVDIKFDFTNKRIIGIMDIDEARLIGNYNIKGKVLILPIDGHGATTIKIYGGRYTFTFDYALFVKNGEEYMKMLKNELAFTIKDAKFNFQNLFNGDKRLGKEMNKFLNENWREVASEFGGVIGKAVSKICEDISKNLIAEIPFRKIFLP